MRLCKICGDKIPSWVKIDDKSISLSSRTSCTKCNPIGQRNVLNGKLTTRIKLGLVQAARPLLVNEFTCKICGKQRKHKSRNLECSTCRSQRIRLTRKQLAVTLCGGGCKTCGYNKCLKALDFHHIDPLTKSFQLSVSWHKSWSILIVEIAKCILLCNRCHTEAHDGKLDVSSYTTIGMGSATCKVLMNPPKIIELRSAKLDNGPGAIIRFRWHRPSTFWANDVSQLSLMTSGQSSELLDCMDGPIDAIKLHFRNLYPHALILEREATTSEEDQYL